jgi:type II secretory pathway component PulF
MTEPEPRRPVVLPLVLALLPALLWAAWVAVMLYLVPRYERTFTDFRLKLPWATEFALDASRWVAKYWYVLQMSLGLLLVAQGVVTWLLLRSRERRRLGVLWALLQIALPLAVIAAVLIPVLTTYADLMEGLQGTKG